MFRSGFIALVGRPNVGKSTLMNTLVGEKMAIVSDKPQTTRHKIRGILSTDEYQVIFLDTPGIHKPRHKLGEKMVSSALSSLREVDLIFFLVDAVAGPGGGDEHVLSLIQKSDTPVFLIINKADLATAERIAELISYYSSRATYNEVVPVSALTGMNRELLLDLAVALLPQGPQYYPAEMMTDQPERLVAAELIREKILEQTREEVPHAVAVEVVEMSQREEKDIIDISVNIYVERKSQKGIIIGKKGAMLKDIGRRAREDIENLLGSQVFLELWVKVKPDWRNKEGSWQAFGLDQD